ncbi:MAG: AAA family ATPase [Sandaracinus sp.]
MAPIHTLDIEGFRAFSRLTLSALAPVNLFVGANNSGKTAMLEAIEAVVSYASPFVLYRASIARGETRVRRDARGDDSIGVDVRRWFHGQDLEANPCFQITARSTSVHRLRRSVAKYGDETAMRRFLNTERAGIDPRLQQLPLASDDYLGIGPPDDLERLTRAGLEQAEPVGFISTDRFGARELAELWSRIVLTPNEERVLDALRLIEPRVDRIAVSIVDGANAAAARVLLRGDRAPVPLGTLGEGVGRMFALASHLVLTRGGFLLIDEIETGLHWSVMPQVWRLLVEVARALDVQVFATTHSRDCLDAIAELSRSHPDLASRVRVHRLEAGRETAATFDASRVASNVELEIETR